MRASAKGIEYPSSLSGSNQAGGAGQRAHGRGAVFLTSDEARRRSAEGARREGSAHSGPARASKQNQYDLQGAGSTGSCPARAAGPGRFLTIENPNGCLCHQRLSLDTPIRR
jgi:hypothetical protein